MKDAFFFIDGGTLDLGLPTYPEPLPFTLFFEEFTGVIDSGCYYTTRPIADEFCGCQR